MCECNVPEVEKLECQPRLMLTDMSLCPVCLGSGTMWVLETWMSSPLGTVVRCWHCSGSGRMYTSTTSEAQRASQDQAANA